MLSLGLVAVTVHLSPLPPAGILTARTHDSSSLPSTFVARTVKGCELSTGPGLAHVTFPVFGSIVVPVGQATNDHVTGGLPLLRAGVIV